MYHIVYKTVNLINDKYYIGVHSTENLNDGYLGSGSAFRNALAKYGRDNFIREVLHVCNSRKEAFEIEKMVVNLDLLRDSNCYNLILGGNSGLQTTKERRKMMPVKVIARVYQEAPYFDNYSNEWVYTIKPNEYFHLAADDNPTLGVMLRKMLEYFFGTEIWVVITKCYNSSKDHQLALKYIKLIEGRFSCFRYSIGIYRHKQILN